MNPLARRFSSILIATLLLLQAVAASGVHVTAAGMDRVSAWPLLDYALFREAHGETSDVLTWRVEVRRASGATHEFDPTGSGSSDPPSRSTRRQADAVRALTRALLDYDYRSIVTWGEALLVDPRDPCVALFLHELRYELGRSGFELVERRCVRTVPMLSPTNVAALESDGRPRERSERWE